MTTPILTFSEQSRRWQFFQQPGVPAVELDDPLNTTLIKAEEYARLMRVAEISSEIFIHAGLKGKGNATIFLKEYFATDPEIGEEVETMIRKKLRIDRGTADGSIPITHSPDLVRLFAENANKEPPEGSTAASIDLVDIVEAILLDPPQKIEDIMKLKNVTLKESAFKSAAKSLKKLGKRGLRLLTPSHPLAEFGTELTDPSVAKDLHSLVGQQNVTEHLLSVLSSSEKSNVLLKGIAGTGKTAIVEGLAREIANGGASLPPEYRGKRIFLVRIEDLRSGEETPKNKAGIIARVQRFLQVAEENRDNSIIFIDEVHMIMNKSGVMSGVDLANLLKPAMARGLIKLIGATTIDEAQVIEEDGALKRRFRPALVEPSNSIETLQILRTFRTKYAERLGCSEEEVENFISDWTLKQAVDFARKFMPNALPDSAIDILDVAVSQVAVRPFVLDKRTELVVQAKLVILNLKQQQGGCNRSDDRENKRWLELQRTINEVTQTMQVHEGAIKRWYEKKEHENLEKCIDAFCADLYERVRCSFAKQRYGKGPLLPATELFAHDKSSFDSAHEGLLTILSGSVPKFLMRMPNLLVSLGKMLNPLGTLEKVINQIKDRIQTGKGGYPSSEDTEYLIGLIDPKVNLRVSVIIPGYPDLATLLQSLRESSTAADKAMNFLQINEPERLNVIATLGSISLLVNTHKGRILKLQDELNTLISSIKQGEKEMFKHLSYVRADLAGELTTVIGMRGSGENVVKAATKVRKIEASKSLSSSLSSEPLPKSSKLVNLTQLLKDLRKIAEDKDIAGDFRRLVVEVLGAFARNIWDNKDIYKGIVKHAIEEWKEQLHTNVKAVIPKSAVTSVLSGGSPIGAVSSALSFLLQSLPRLGKAILKSLPSREMVIGLHKSHRTLFQVEAKIILRAIRKEFTSPDDSATSLLLRRIIGALFSRPPNTLLEKIGMHALSSEVTELALANAVHDLTGINPHFVIQTDGERIEALARELRSKVVGQPIAVNVLIDVMRRSLMGLRDPTKPMGVLFLFGPTGVGKTYIAEIAAETVFGDPRRITRINMGEYQDKTAVNKLFGAPPGYIGYYEGGQLTEAVRRQPFQVVVLDEMEKAHPLVFRAVLAILDKGEATDGRGRVVDFKNTLIVMTSNAGQEEILAHGQAILTSSACRPTKADSKRMRVILKSIEKSGLLDIVLLWFPIWISSIEGWKGDDELQKLDKTQMEKLLTEFVRAQRRNSRFLGKDLPQLVKALIEVLHFSRERDKPLFDFIESRIDANGIVQDFETNVNVLTELKRLFNLAKVLRHGIGIWEAFSRGSIDTYPWENIDDQTKKYTDRVEKFREFLNALRPALIPSYPHTENGEAAANAFIERNVKAFYNSSEEKSLSIEDEQRMIELLMGTLKLDPPTQAQESESETLTLGVSPAFMQKVLPELVSKSLKAVQGTDQEIGRFSLEFVNRVTVVPLFPLDKTTKIRIAYLEVLKWKRSLEDDHSIQLEIDGVNEKSPTPWNLSVTKFIAKEVKSLWKLGARPIKRLIEQEVGRLVSRLMVSDALQAFDGVLLTENPMTKRLGVIHKPTLKKIRLEGFRMALGDKFPWIRIDEEAIRVLAMRYNDLKPVNSEGNLDKLLRAMDLEISWEDYVQTGDPYLLQYDRETKRFKLNLDTLLFERYFLYHAIGYSLDDPEIWEEPDQVAGTISSKLVDLAGLTSHVIQGLAEPILPCDPFKVGYTLASDYALRAKFKLKGSPLAFPGFSIALSESASKRLGSWSPTEGSAYKKLSAALSQAVKAHPPTLRCEYTFDVGKDGFICTHTPGKEEGEFFTSSTPIENGMEFFSGGPQPPKYNTLLPQECLLLEMYRRMLGKDFPWIRMDKKARRALAIFHKELNPVADETNLDKFKRAIESAIPWRDYAKTKDPYLLTYDDNTQKFKLNLDKSLFEAYFLHRAIGYDLNDPGIWDQADNVLEIISRTIIEQGSEDPILPCEYSKIGYTLASEEKVRERLTIGGSALKFTPFSVKLSDSASAKFDSWLPTDGSMFKKLTKALSRTLRKNRPTAGCVYTFELNQQDFKCTFTPGEGEIKFLTKAGELDGPRPSKYNTLLPKEYLLLEMYRRMLGKDFPWIRMDKKARRALAMFHKELKPVGGETNLDKFKRAIESAIPWSDYANTNDPYLLTYDNNTQKFKLNLDRSLFETYFLHHAIGYDLNDPGIWDQADNVREIISRTIIEQESEDPILPCEYSKIGYTLASEERLRERLKIGGSALKFTPFSVKLSDSASAKFDSWLPTDGSMFEKLTKALSRTLRKNRPTAGCVYTFELNQQDFTCTYTRGEGEIKFLTKAGDYGDRPSTYDTRAPSGKIKI